MHKIILTSTLFIFLQCAQTKAPQKNSQAAESPHSTEIQDSSITVQSINFQFENDDDLKKIARQIGQKRIVMLGEQSHGDGASFALKARLIKFLHKQMGFNVLVFEADFYSLYQASTNNIQPIDWNQIAQENIYPFWAKAPRIEPLWNYINQTQNSDHPLHVAGMDSRHIGKYAQANFLADLEDILKQVIPELIQRSDYSAFCKILSSLLLKEQETKKQYDLETKEQFLQTLDEIKVHIEKQEKLKFWQQEIDNLIAYTRDSWSSDFFSFRSHQMGKNLIWLLEQQFPGEKVIVWSHNQHILKSRAVEVALLKQYNPDADALVNNPLFTEPGEVIAQKYPSEVFSIGFLTNGGTYSAYVDAVIHPRIFDLEKLRETRAIDPTNPGSLEQELAELNEDFLFVNLESKKHTLFETRALKNHHPKGAFQAEWKLAYDAFFYIREMTPIFDRND